MQIFDWLSVAIKLKNIIIVCLGHLAHRHYNVPSILELSDTSRAHCTKDHKAYRFLLLSTVPIGASSHFYTFIVAFCLQCTGISHRHWHMVLTFGLFDSESIFTSVATHRCSQTRYCQGTLHGNCPLKHTPKTLAASPPLPFVCPSRTYGYIRSCREKNQASEREN